MNVLWRIKEKCTMQSAPNVDKNVRSLSNQTEADQCIVENVTQREDQPEEIDIRLTS